MLKWGHKRSEETRVVFFYFTHFLDKINFQLLSITYHEK